MKGKLGRLTTFLTNAVIRRNKTSTKFSVVYDASARSNGTALNDCLYTGPPLTENILYSLEISSQQSSNCWCVE